MQEFFINDEIIDYNLDWKILYVVMLAIFNL